MEQIVIEPTSGVILVEVEDSVADAVVIPIGVPGPAAPTDHGELTGRDDDDHPQYLNQTRGDARYSQTGHTHSGIYDPAGTAASAVAAHAAEADPHPGYLTPVEGDARYDAAGAAAAAQSAAVQRGNHSGSQAIATVTGLQTALDGKAANTHAHAIADVTGLQTALDSKAANATTLAGYGIGDAYTKTETDGRIQAVVGAAPAALDTLAEIATQLGNDENAVAALTATVAGKESTGVAATLDGAHLAAANPHPQYQQAAGVAGLIAAAVGVTVQAYHATLGLLAAIATTAFGRSLLALADAAALRTAIALPTVTTTGRLARYTDAAGTLGQTITLYDDGAGNVGVGTTTPVNKLHIFGASTDTINSASTAILKIEGSSTAALHFGSTSSAPYGQWVQSGSRTSPATAYPLLLNPVGGHVGIGVTLPVCKLDVDGPIRTRPATVATLPSATLGDGMRHVVTDATQTLAAGLGAAVTGGGANKVPVISLGNSWIIGG